MNEERKDRSSGNRRTKCGIRLLQLLLSFGIALFLTACTQLQKPEPDPFFAQSDPPKAQEFRWSNGRLPKSFDPALAAAPPETDVVRALYEGLTETDPSTLEEIPGVAESWTPSDDFRAWTFKLRKDAKWSNGKPVSASDFVRAWTRLVKLGDKAAHRHLLANIVGVPKTSDREPLTDTVDRTPARDPIPSLAPPMAQRLAKQSANSNQKAAGNDPEPKKAEAVTGGPADETARLGVVAEDDHTIKVLLNFPDKEFPRLVANPIFRPIFSNGEEFIGKNTGPNIVTNGAFRITSGDQSGLVLEPSASYWNRKSVRLERVKIVAMNSPEQALAAYQAGELDAITNADLSPLVLKLLSPYDDFRKTTHSALNLYEVNTTKQPFSDRRVRQALSGAIERERLTETEMDGMTRPALGFLPYSTGETATLTQDREKARELLVQAGFPGGEGFPVIRLLVNRNDTQQRVAKSVARMWKQNLNIDTEIVVKEMAEIEQARTNGDFDLVRRGVVLPTSDQAASLMAIFEPVPPSMPAKRGTAFGLQPTPTVLPHGPSEKSGDQIAGDAGSARESSAPVILNENEALYELRAIPLYFPTSFALVKPYVDGFETNSLDVISLANVAIDSNWRLQSQDQ